MTAQELHKELYPVGSRVRLVACGDEYTRLTPGEKGTVTLIDSVGTVHVDWDSGSKLGMCLDDGDRIVRIREETDDA